MSGSRIEAGTERALPVVFRFDGVEIEAFAGETVAAALWASGRRTFRQSVVRREPRSVYCNMGVCFDCLVRVDGHAVRACMTPVRDGLEVESA